jgi:hypothetical protein
VLRKHTLKIYSRSQAKAQLAITAMDRSICANYDPISRCCINIIPSLLFIMVLIISLYT